MAEQTFASPESACLAFIGEGWHTLGTQPVDDEDFAGIGFVVVPFDAGGDEEAVEVWAAESAGGCFDGGDVDLLQLLPVFGVEADDTSAVAEGDPDFIFGIDGHAIGRAVVTGGGRVNDHASLDDVSAGFVVIVGANRLGRRIDVVKGMGCGIPAEAVGVGYVLDFDFEIPVGVEAVELGVTGFFDQANGSGPETPGGITFTVVEAVVRSLVGLWIGEGLLFTGGGIEAIDAAVAGAQVAAARTGDDGANALAHIVNGLPAGFGIQLNQGVPLDIDIDQLVLPPDGTFAPLGDAGADGLDCWFFHRVKGSMLRSARFAGQGSGAVERWSGGAVEYWSIGVLEYWSLV